MTNDVQPMGVVQNDHYLSDIVIDIAAYQNVLLRVVVFDFDDNDEVEDRNSNADTNMHNTWEVTNALCRYHNMER